MGHAGWGSMHKHVEDLGVQGEGGQARGWEPGAGSHHIATFTTDLRGRQEFYIQTGLPGPRGVAKVGRQTLTMC